jgi:hypothetical protein
MSKIKVLYLNSYRPSLLGQFDVEVNVHKECAGALQHMFNDIIERHGVSHSDYLSDFSSCQNLDI